MDVELGIVGAGQMGGAVLERVVASGVVPADRVTVADADADLVAALAARLGVTGTTDNAAAAAADVVVLALKPQVLPRALPELATGLREDAVVVSLAAGATSHGIRELLGGHDRVVRVMPNTPARVGVGMLVVAAEPDDEALDLVCELMAPLGEVRRLPERLFDAVTAVSGSGPAYVFLLAEALAEAGVLVGLSRADATALADQTLLGAATLLAREGDAAGLRTAVTSPGGTTAAGLRELERGGLRAAVLDAVVAATERGRALARGDD